MKSVLVCKEGEMRDGDVRIVKLGKIDVGVYRRDGAWYAYRNQCVHQGGPACEGLVRFKVVDIIAADKTFQGQTYDESDPHIVCPWHSYEFHLKTGRCATDPALGLRKHEVTVRDGDVYVDI